MAENSVSQEVCLKYVGFWKRFLAYLMDTLIIVIIIYILISMFGLKQNASIVASLLIITYNAFFNVKYGGTLGKLYMDLRIVNEEGSKISFKQVLIRLFPFLLTSIINYIKQMQDTNSISFMILENICGFLLIGDYLSIIVNGKKRAFHDLLAGTFVVTKKSQLAYIENGRHDSRTDFVNQ